MNGRRIETCGAFQRTRFCRTRIVRLNLARKRSTVAPRMTNPIDSPLFTPILARVKRTGHHFILSRIHCLPFGGTNVIGRYSVEPFIVIICKKNMFIL